MALFLFFAYGDFFFFPPTAKKGAQQFFSPAATAFAQKDYFDPNVAPAHQRTS